MNRIICVSLLACFFANPATVLAEVNIEAAQETVNEAAAVYRESQSRGHAWQQTRVHLENAQAALQRGEPALAVKEAERSIGLGKASLAQAEAEQSAWHSRFPKVP